MRKRWPWLLVVLFLIAGTGVLIVLDRPDTDGHLPEGWTPAFVGPQAMAGDPMRETHGAGEPYGRETRSYTLHRLSAEVVAQALRELRREDGWVEERSTLNMARHFRRTRGTQTVRVLVRPTKPRKAKAPPKDTNVAITIILTPRETWMYKLRQKLRGSTAY